MGIKEIFKSLKWYEWIMLSIMIAVAIYAMVVSSIGIESDYGKARYKPTLACSN